MVVIGLDFHDFGIEWPSRTAQRLDDHVVRALFHLTPSLRSSRVGAAMRSHSFTRSVASPVMRVGWQERREHHQSRRDVGHAGHVDGTVEAAASARGPSMIVCVGARMTRAPSFSHSAEETVVALAVAGAQVAERDARAMQRGERREIGGRRGVALDVDVARPIHLRRDARRR